MRRWLAITALSVAMAAPLLAQMHGGSRGGASMGRGGFSSSGFHGGFSSSGFRGGANVGVGPRFGESFGTGLRQRSFRSGPSFGGFRRPVFGPRRFRNRFFFSTFSPVFFGYYGYPAYYGGYAYSTADYSPSYDYYGSSYYSTQSDIAQQQQDIHRLEDEVARLREQRESGQGESRDAPTPQAESRPVVSTPTLLVFRDKHTQEVQSYAIVGGTLWIFSEQRATKLPLSWLDLEATTKANDDRGVDFQIPR
jgi:hypothetical protein